VGRSQAEVRDDTWSQLLSGGRGEAVVAFGEYVFATEPEWGKAAAKKEGGLGRCWASEDKRKR
jgi:hypothetical protein